MSSMFFVCVASPQRVGLSCESDQNVCESDQNVCESDQNVCESDQNVCESDQNVCKSDQNVCESDQNVCESDQNTLFLGVTHHNTDPTHKRKRKTSEVSLK